MYAFPSRIALGLALVAVAGSAVACSAGAKPVASGNPPALAAPITPEATPARPEVAPVEVEVEPSTVPRATPTPLTADEVRNATFTIPQWTGSNCPTDRVRFTNGQHAFGAPRDNISFGPDVVMEDADHDGDKDAIVLLRCRPAEFDLRQVVVVTRTGTNGVRLLGQVATALPQPRGLGQIHDIGGLDRGRVQLLWADSTVRAPLQFRFYAWTGRDFRQVAGPTRF